MATTASQHPVQLPPDIQAAIENGECLTQEQLRTLIEFQAAQLGLDFDEAIERAREDSLPRNTIGTDLRLLVSLLSG